MSRFFWQGFDDLRASLEHLVDAPKPVRGLLIAFATMTVAWFVYVPIHELLHVAGCLLTGGSVSELEIQAEYGGVLLAEVFDFVVVGGEYSGRLSGFDTGGSDLVYLATDIGPYLLSIFLGVPLLRLCARRARPWLFGPAIVVGVAPFYNLLGDYYEMGSVALTGLLSLLSGGKDGAFESLRSDDLVMLLGKLFSEPGELGLEGGGELALGALVVLASSALGVLLCLATYDLGVRFANRVLPSAD